MSKSPDKTAEPLSFDAPVEMPKRRESRRQVLALGEEGPLEFIRRINQWADDIESSATVPALTEIVAQIEAVVEDSEKYRRTPYGHEVDAAVATAILLVVSRFELFAVDDLSELLAK